MSMATISRQLMAKCRLITGTSHVDLIVRHELAGVLRARHEIIHRRMQVLVVTAQAAGHACGDSPLMLAPLSAVLNEPTTHPIWRDSPMPAASS